MEENSSMLENEGELFNKVVSTIAEIVDVTNGQQTGSSETSTISILNNSDELIKCARNQRNTRTLSKETEGFVDPDELVPAISLQRELRKLRFENPGEAMVEGTKIVIKQTPSRPKRRVAAKTAINKNYKPYHDRQGKFVTPTGNAVDLCDCLDATCSGCHVPCRKCESQKCSFQCRNNRNTIVEEVEIQGTDKRVKNPYLE